jgi:hypothetical protein
MGYRAGQEVMEKRKISFPNQESNRDSSGHLVHGPVATQGERCQLQTQISVFFKKRFFYHIQRQYSENIMRTFVIIILCNFKPDICSTQIK